MAWFQQIIQQLGFLLLQSRALRSRKVLGRHRLGFSGVSVEGRGFRGHVGLKVWGAGSGVILSEHPNLKALTRKLPRWAAWQQLSACPCSGMHARASKGSTTRAPKPEPKAPPEPHTIKLMLKARSPSRDRTFGSEGFDFGY